MGSGRTQSKTPDLFSTASERVLTSPSINSPPSSLTTDDVGAAASSLSYTLPTNLPSALRHLDDDQLDRLVASSAERMKRINGSRPRRRVRRFQMQRASRTEPGNSFGNETNIIRWFRRSARLS